MRSFEPLRAILAAFLLFAGGSLFAAAADEPSECGMPRHDPAEEGLSAAELGAMADALERYVETGELAGFEILVARRGAVIQREARGFADLEARRPIDSKTIYRLASLTKPVVSVVLLDLVGEGALSLDDPVERHLPAFRSLRRPEGSRKPTVRDLVSHTSGIDGPQWSSPERAGLWSEAGLGEAVDLAGLVERVARVPLAYPPGGGWFYGLGHDVAARVAEVVSGRRLEELIAERVTSPLGLDSMRYRSSGDRGELAVLYSRRDDGLVRADRGGPEYPRGSTGLVSTACDYLNFARMLLGGGEVDGRRVLAAETVAEMTRNHLPASLTPIAVGGFTFHGNGYGLGVGVSLEDGLEIGSFVGLPAGSFWWLGAVQTYFWVDRRHEIVAVLMTQSTDLGRNPIQYQFQTGVYRALRAGS